jgi:hypothetical protein
VRASAIDVTEALANAAVGLLVSWAATYWLLPLWGLTPSASASLGITGMFFALSFARAWALRWAFRRIGGKINVR